MALQAASGNNVSPTPTAAVEDGLITKSDASGMAAATRRKSSTWKAFNIKKQLIKVDSRLRNTFVTAASPEPQKSGSTFYAPEGGDVAGINPGTSASSATNATGLAFAHNDRNEYLEQIESEIVQSLNEVQASGNDESVMDATESLAGPDPNAGHSSGQQQQPRSILNCNTNEQSENSSPNTKRVEFSEEPVQRVAFVSPVEGAFISRPSDLPLGESSSEDRPVPPPRISKYKNNKQRLLSVPNIKYTKQQQTEFPMRGKMSVGHKDSLSNLLPATTGGTNVASGGAGNHNNNNNAGTSSSSSFANSFMRRFSKYQLWGSEVEG